MYLAAVPLIACLAAFVFYGSMIAVALAVPSAAAFIFFVRLSRDDYEYNTIMDAVARKDRQWLTDLYQSWPPAKAPTSEALQRMIWSKNSSPAK